MTTFVLGMAWVVIGVHLLVWLAARYDEELDSVVGDIGEGWRGSIRGWIAVVLWPLTALLVWATLNLERFDDGEF